MILDVLINALFVDGVWRSVAAQHIKSNANYANVRMVVEYNMVVNKHSTQHGSATPFILTRHMEERQYQHQYQLLNCRCIT